MAFPVPRPQIPRLPTRRIREIPTGQRAVRAARFNVDGNYCLTCGSDKSLKLWNPHRGTLLKTYCGHGYEVLDAAGSCDNSQICSCGADKTVILWDVATGKLVRKFRGHGGKVNCVQFNEESTVIVSGSIDTSIRCWDCRSRTSEPIQILDEAKDGVSSVQVSDHEILSGSVDGRIRRYDLRMGQVFVDFIGSPISSVCWSRDGQCSLSSSLDFTLRLLDKETGELLGDYTGHKNTEYKLDCCFNESDTHVVSGSEDGLVYFWDLVKGSLAVTLPVGKGVVQSVSYHPTQSCLLTATQGVVQLWGDETYEVDTQSAL